MTKLPSRFQLGDAVRSSGQSGTVVAVTFTEGKVSYQILTTSHHVIHSWSEDVHPPLGIIS